MKSIEVSKQEYEWGEPDYKIYPSGFTSKTFELCPAEHIVSLENWGGIAQLAGVYKVRRGSAVHEEYQNELLESDKLYPKPENIADERMKQKLEDKWPEVPFHDHETGISGSVDLVMTWKKAPCLIEIKSTSIDPTRWEEYKSKSLPSEHHLIQFGIYYWELLKLGYYAEIPRGVLVYNNLLFPPGDEKGELELLIPPDYELKKYPGIKLIDLAEDLILNLQDCRNQYIQNGKDGVVCHYGRCRKHKKKAKPSLKPKKEH